MRLLSIAVMLFVCMCVFAPDGYCQNDMQNMGTRFLSSLQSLSAESDGFEFDPDNLTVEYAVNRVKENPLLGIIPLVVFIIGLVMNFHVTGVVISALALFGSLVFFPVSAPIVGIFLIFATIYHFILRPDR